MIDSSLNELEYNFKPDYVFKYLFTNLSTPTRIKLINSIFGIYLEEDSEIIVLNTENIFVSEINQKIEKSYSDTLLKTNHKRKIHIEFQSTNDKTIGVRVFLYGLEAAKTESNENVLKFPLPHILYTIPYGKSMYGKETVILDVPNYIKEENIYKDCRIQINIKYTNLLEFSLDDFSKKSLEALSFIYLYRYIKKQNKCRTEKDIECIVNEVDTVSEILKNLPQKDRQKLSMPMADIIKDISKIAEKNDIKKEVVSMLETRARTYSESMWDDGFDKGAEKEKKDVIKKMLNKKYSEDIIAEICDVDIEYIFKIKNEMN